jgi:hypothetical protein
MLASKALHETSQRNCGNLNREMHFARRPAKGVNTRTTTTNTALDELGESFVVGRLGENLAAFVAMEDYVVDPTRNMKSS